MQFNYYLFAKRTFDICFATIVLIILIPVLLIAAISVKITSSGPTIHWSKRVGINNKIFLMPKFRSMKTTTPDLATHKLTDSQSYITPVGGFLRKSSIDELPQLYCVLIGQMSLVGPRPALHNQYDLISLRTNSDVHMMLPGLTGLAQISGRDELSIEQKTKLDEKYMLQRSFFLDMRIIINTLFKSAMAAGVDH